MYKVLNLICINEFNIIELIYSAISISTMHKSKLIQLIIVNQYKSIHINAKNAIVFIVLHIKHYYNQNHTLQFFCIDNDINLQLHYDYILLSIQNKKLSQLFIDSLYIMKWIDWIVYQLNLFNIWRIHNVVSIVYLESVYINNFYWHFWFSHSDVIITLLDSESEWKIEHLIWK